MRPLIALALLVAIAGAVGYGIGVEVTAGHGSTEVKVFRDIPAQVGDGQVSASVDGVWYGTASAVPWVDASGSYHTNGWPACLPYRSEPRITFGGALIYGPTGGGDYRIVWVDCRR